jgi:hypothetical protein
VRWVTGGRDSGSCPVVTFFITGVKSLVYKNRLTTFCSCGNCKQELTETWRKNIFPCVVLP